MALLISCDFNMFLALLILPQGIVIIDAIWSDSSSANNFLKHINFRFESIIINILPVLFSIGWLPVCNLFSPCITSAVFLFVAVEDFGACVLLSIFLSLICFWIIFSVYSFCWSSLIFHFSSFHTEWFLDLD